MIILLRPSTRSESNSSIMRGYISSTRRRREGGKGERE